MLKRSLTFLFLMLLAPAIASAQLKVVATTEDLGSLAREIGGTRVHVEAIFKGSQDPHQLGAFLESHHDRRLSLERADLFIAVGQTLEGTGAYGIEIP